MSCGSVVLTVAVVLACGKQHVPKPKKTEHTNSDKVGERNVATKNKRTCRVLKMFLPLILVVSLFCFGYFLTLFLWFEFFVLLVLYGYGFSTCHSNLEAMPDSK